MISMSLETTKESEIVRKALKVFYVSDEIEDLHRSNQHVPAFLLLACQVESHCFRLAMKLQDKLGSRFRHDGRKSLERASFGDLIGIIQESNDKNTLRIDQNLLIDLQKINELRVKILHRLLRDFNMTWEAVIADSQNLYSVARKVQRELWKNYTNNPLFLN